MKLSTRVYNQIITGKKAAPDLATAAYVRRRLKRSGCVCVPTEADILKAPISTHPYFVEQRVRRRITKAIRRITG